MKLPAPGKGENNEPSTTSSGSGNKTPARQEVNDTDTPIPFESFDDASIASPRTENDGTPAAQQDPSLDGFHPKETTGTSATASQQESKSRGSKGSKGNRKGSSDRGERTQPPNRQHAAGGQLQQQQDVEATFEEDEEDEEYDGFDEDGFDEDAVHVGEGYSEELSVVSDMTTPTVVSSLEVSEEEQYWDMVGGGMKFNAPKKKDLLSRVAEAVIPKRKPSATGSDTAPKKPSRRTSMHFARPENTSVAAVTKDGKNKKTTRPSSSKGASDPSQESACFLNRMYAVPSARSANSVATAETADLKHCDVNDILLRTANGAQRRNADGSPLDRRVTADTQDLVGIRSVLNNDTVAVENQDANSTATVETADQSDLCGVHDILLQQRRNADGSLFDRRITAGSQDLKPIKSVLNGSQLGNADGFHSASAGGIGGAQDIEDVFSATGSTADGTAKAQGVRENQNPSGSASVASNGDVDGDEFPIEDDSTQHVPNDFHSSASRDSGASLAGDKKEETTTASPDKKQGPKDDEHEELTPPTDVEQRQSRVTGRFSLSNDGGGKIGAVRDKDNVVEKTPASGNEAAKAPLEEAPDKAPAFAKKGKEGKKDTSPEAKAATTRGEFAKESAEVAKTSSDKKKNDAQIVDQKGATEAAASGSAKNNEKAKATTPKQPETPAQKQEEAKPPAGTFKSPHCGKRNKDRMNGTGVSPTLKNTKLSPSQQAQKQSDGVAMDVDSPNKASDVKASPDTLARRKIVTAKRSTLAPPDDNDDFVQDDVDVFMEEPHTAKPPAAGIPSSASDPNITKEAIPALTVENEEGKDGDADTFPPSNDDDESKEETATIASKVESGDKATEVEFGKYEAPKPTVSLETAAAAVGDRNRMAKIDASTAAVVETAAAAKPSGGPEYRFCPAECCKDKEMKPFSKKQLERLDEGYPSARCIECCTKAKEAAGRNQRQCSECEWYFGIDGFSKKMWKKPASKRLCRENECSPEVGESKPPIDPAAARQAFQAYKDKHGREAKCTEMMEKWDPKTDLKTNKNRATVLAKRQSDFWENRDNAIVHKGLGVYKDNENTFQVLVAGSICRIKKASQEQLSNLPKHRREKDHYGVEYYKNIIVDVNGVKDCEIGTLVLSAYSVKLTFLPEIILMIKECVGRDPNVWLNIKSSACFIKFVRNAVLDAMKPSADGDYSFRTTEGSNQNIVFTVEDYKRLPHRFPPGMDKKKKSMLDKLELDWWTITGGAPEKDKEAPFEYYVPAMATAFQQDEDDYSCFRDTLLSTLACHDQYMGRSYYTPHLPALKEKIDQISMLDHNDAVYESLVVEAVRSHLQECLHVTFRIDRLDLSDFDPFNNNLKFPVYARLVAPSHYIGLLPRITVEPSEYKALKATLANCEIIAGEKGYQGIKHAGIIWTTEDWKAHEERKKASSAAPSQEAISSGQASSAVSSQEEKEADEEQGIAWALVGYDSSDSE